MDYIKLCDVCDFQGGSQPPKDEWSFTPKDGYVRMLQIRDFTQGERVIPEYIKLTNTTKICEADDILIARYGASLGKILTGLSGAYNVAIMRTIPNTELLEKKYLYYYLKAPVFQNFLLRIGNRAAQAGFNKNDLQELLIPCVSRERQKEVVCILEKVETLICALKQQLQKLDELVKARFIEMFGEYIEKTTPVEFETICELVTVGIANSATHAFCDDGVVMLRNQNIKEDYLDDSDIVRITPSFAEKYKSKKLKQNDLLIVRTGYPGVACLVPQKYNGCQTFTTLIARVKNCAAVIPRFVCHYINSEYGKKYVRDNSAGAAQQNFGATTLSKMPIYIPPIELQNKYIEFVKQTDKLKETIQKAMDETQLLFDSLMQKYFG